jgi:subtilisin family serine protease
MKRLSMAIATIMFVTFALFNNSESTQASSDKFKRSASAIPNRYIVVLNDEPVYGISTEVADLVPELAAEYRGKVDRVYASALRGYSVEMTEKEAIRLSNDPRVKYVEEDGVVEPSEVQTNATWGISRIDQRNWQYPLSADYEYNATGASVNVYVLDTGILTTHPDFGGRAFNAANTSGDNTRIEECNGHGTHVAGTIGSNTFGVAKAATLYSVRVFPCWGGSSVSNVASGIDWVSQHATFPAVANMSLGTSFSTALNSAVQTLLNRGVTVTVAAGNSNEDACGSSPGSVSGVLTVGATDNRDYKSNASNWGSCVDLFAPGVGIESTWNQMDVYPVFTMSGTSTASPHVAGAAALYLQANPSASPQQVNDALLRESTSGILTDIGGSSPNLFLFSGFVTPGGPVGPPACSGNEFNGSIFTAGANSYQSSKNGFGTRQGMMSGRLNVPENANFRLHLEKKASRGSFNVVASSTGGNSQETVEFRVRNGTYRWRIESLSGAGEYALCSVAP